MNGSLQEPASGNTWKRLKWNAITYTFHFPFHQVIWINFYFSNCTFFFLPRCIGLSRIKRLTMPLLSCSKLLYISVRREKQSYLQWITKSNNSRLHTRWWIRNLGAIWSRLSFFFFFDTGRYFISLIFVILHLGVTFSIFATRGLLWT